MFAGKRRRQEDTIINKYKKKEPLVNRNNAPKVSTFLKTGSKPSCIEIRGIPVHFPFTPYPCQVDYMTKVIDALNRSENALLESPTGTGKTLCLLCAALAWQREQARFLPQNQKFSQDPVESIPSLELESDTKSTQLQQQQQQEQQQRGRVPTILYASRTHSQISQVVKELRSTRYRPKHAVLASREQMCVHERISKLNNAMQLNHECSKLTKDRRCRFKNNTETFTPTSQDQLDPSHSQPVLDMEDLLLMGKRNKVCPFFFTRNQISDSDIIFLPYNYLFDREARKTLGGSSGPNENSNGNSKSGSKSSIGGINWKNAIVIFDEAHNLESFASDSASFDLSGLDIAGCIGEVERALGMLHMSSTTDTAENHKMEGNMIKLKAIFLQMEQYLDKNIPARGGSYSGDYIFEIWKEGAHVTFHNHELFINFVKLVSDLFMEMRGAAGTPKLDHFVSCLRRTFAGSTEDQCLAKAKAYRVHITPSKTTSNTPGQFEYRTMSYWCFAPALSMYELAGLGPLRSMLVTSGTLSPLPSYSLELGLPFPIQLENPHIVKPNQIHVRVIGKGVSNKLLKSTYERRDNPEYIAELGNTLVSLAKIVPGGMLIFFPSYGVMEKCVEGWGGPARQSHNFTAKDKKKSFFTSKTSSKRFSFPHAPNFYASSSGQMTPWKRLLSQKAIVLEPKASADLKPAIEEFDKFLSSKGSTGCLLMGVCRGKISEGIDFADHRARAVVITGLPFAPFHDPKVKLKREFLDGVKMEKQLKPTGEGGFKTQEQIGDKNNFTSADSAISGTEWYSQQAHRAVNQAVGRVIRHRFDYGAILLLDARFEEPRNQAGLSRWVRPHISPDEGFGKAISNLAKFYRGAQNDPDLSSRGGTCREKRVLRYEDENQDSMKLDLMQEMEMNQNIAVIQADDSKEHTDLKSNEGMNVEAISGYVRPDRIIKRFNINDEKRKSENLNAMKNIIDTVSCRSPTRIKNQSHKSIGISALYTKRKEKKMNVSAGLQAFTKNEDMTSTIASAWAGLEQKAVSTNKISMNYNRLRQTNETSRGNMSSSNVSTPSSAQAKDKEMNKTNATLFYKIASANLSANDLSNLQMILVKMKKAGDNKDQLAYLRFAKNVIIILLKYDNVRVNDTAGVEIIGLLKIFYPLIPISHRSAVRKIASDLVAAKKIKDMKMAEKKRSGERGLDRVLKQEKVASDSIKEFEKLQRDKKLSEANPFEAAERQERAAALIRAEEINQAAKKEVKKLELNMKSTIKSQSSKSLSPLRMSEQYKHSNTFSRNTLYASTKKKRKHVSVSSDVNQYLTQDMSEVDKCLHQASIISNNYTPKKKHIKEKSNIPNDLVCIICDSKPKRPHLANCGHSACFSCWKQWLDKLGEGRGTCPVCRAHTNIKDLARMVFKKDVEARTPTLSQICEMEQGSESDSEDELEIIEKF